MHVVAGKDGWAHWTTTDDSISPQPHLVNRLSPSRACPGQLAKVMDQFEKQFEDTDVRCGAGFFTTDDVVPATNREKSWTF